MTTPAVPTEHQILGFVDKLESFARGLTDAEQEMLRIALGISRANAAEVRARLTRVK